MFKGLLDKAPIAVLVSRLSDGEVLYANHKVAAFLGLSLDQLIGKTTPDFYFDPSDRMRVLEALRTKGKVENFELHVKRADGAPFWVETSFERTTFEGESAIFAGYIDITERKKAEEALRDSEQRHRKIFELAPIGMTLVARDRKFLSVNDRFREMLGYETEELIGHSFEEFTHPEDLDEKVERAQKALDGQSSVNYEKRYIRKDGETVFAQVTGGPVFDEHGTPLYGIALIEDITERKQAEEAAKESEENYRSLVELSPDAVFVQQDGKIIFANSSAVRLYGADEPEQFVGREMTSLVHPEDRNTLLERREALKHDEKKLVFRALRRLRLDGSEFYGESVVSLIPWKGAQAAMIVIRDHTERQAIEEQLRQAQKMEAVGQLTGGIAHDFNNLLTVVLGNLELLRDESAEHEKQHRYIESAIHATEQGAMLTERLLAFSRKQTLHPQGLNLNELVAGMSDMLQRTLGETIEIEAKISDSLWPVFADSAQVESALLNLALNARDAMRNGGNLIIEAANIKIDDDYVAAHADVGLGDYVLLSVSDTGTGMPPEILERVFEPFYTTKEVGQGSGLGLSMVYGFAKQSDGHLTIYSEEGHGTTVKLYLPRAKQVDQQAEPDVELDVSGAREDTILVVEDDPDVRTLAVTLLGDLGYEVLEAGDGASAIAAMKSRARIDLLFTDVILAGDMSGPELAEEAKRFHPAMRILFMSGYPSEAMVRRGEMERGSDVLNKPFRKADLARKVREVLRKLA